MGKQGRGSLSSGKTGSATGAKKKMVIKPFKVCSDATPPPPAGEI